MIWGFVAAFLAALTPYAVFICTDAPPPEDGDLMPEERFVPPEENAYPEIVAIDAGAMADPWDFDSPWFEGLEPNPAIDAEVYRFVLSEGDAWRGSAAARAAHALLGENVESFERLRAALRRPHYDRGFDIDFDTSGYGDEIIQRRYLANWLMFRFQVALLDGRSEDAVEEIELTLRLGTLTLNGSRSMVSTLVAVAILGVGLSCSDDLLEHHELDARALARLSGVLDDAQVEQDAINRTIRSEYQWAKDIVREAGEEFWFKPNRTLDVIAGHHRVWLEERRKPLLEQRIPDTGSSPLWVDARPWRERVIEALSGNNLGGQYIHMLKSSSAKIEARLSSLRFRLDASRLAVACLRFHRRDGHLPESFDLLVPEFLPDIPSDPFTGDAVRYDPDRAVLWSPGSDGIDEGGLAADAEWSDEEPTLFIPLP